MIDVDRHVSDDEVRSTLLHEMAHAAAGRGRFAHGYQFWAQVEKLLRQRAPFKVDFPETGGLAIVDKAVPARFSLARQAMKKLEHRRQTHVARQMKAEEFEGEFTIDDEYIAERFVEAARLPWKSAVWSVGKELGLIDMEGRPDSAWAKRAIARGKKAYLRARKIRAAYLRMRGHLTRG